MSEEKDPFDSNEYREIVTEHLYRTIDYLLHRGVEFAVAAEVEHLGFEPPLPEEIREGFAEVALFVLSGYTYESASLSREALIFEAGFGEGNYGSWVTIPLAAIRQIFVGEFPVAINVAPFAREESEPETERSMEALLNNPENRKLLKKKRK